MADADWGDLTAPLRRAAQAFADSNGLLQKLGNDRGFWARLQALTELPAVVGFHPFAETQQWSVDLEQDRQASAEQAAARQAWSPRLTRQARRREQIGLVGSAAAAGANPASAPRGTAPMQGASMASMARDANTDGQPRGGSSVQSTGAWSALLQITQLLEELEPQTAGPAPSSPSVAASAASASRTSRRTPQLEPAARGGNQGRAVAGISPAQSAESARAAAVPAGPDQPAALLEQYVAALWTAAGSGADAGAADSAARAAAEQPAAGLAPRAPSLLLPTRTQREAQPGAAQTTQAADAALPPFVWPANDEQTEESVEERINRALLEQAWLRGVDLT